MNRPTRRQSLSLCSEKVLRRLQRSETDCAQLLEFTEEPGSDDTVALIERLRHVATSVQERRLITAIALNRFDTFADVDRIWGWSHGQARVIAMRLARKVRRAA